jgi:multicomponent Na+:H+ antiporter subunit E
LQFFASFIILFVFWIIWSGKLDPFHLILGVISVGLVSAWSGDLLVEKPGSKKGSKVMEMVRFEIYSVWLLYQVVLANIHVIWVSFHPNMEEILDPQMVTFESKLPGDLPKFVLAQSITLTPGTVSVRVDDNKFLVHALTKQTADGVPGAMEKLIAKVFKGRK